MLQGAITGIDPFVPWSTFKGPTIEIPKGLFLGGIFYTDEPYTAPCHISFISGPDQDCLGTWGIADAEGKELGQIIFSGSNPNLGNILTTNADYGGCLKGRFYNYNNRPTGSEDNLPISDLEVFLRSVYGEHTLDTDSLILDVCTCCSVPHKESNKFALKNVELPEGMSLVEDANGLYYVADAENNTPPEEGIKALKCQIAGTASSCTVSGAMISILPWTVSGAVTTTPAEVTEHVASGGYVKYSDSVGVEDILVVSANGGVVIGTKNQVGQQLS